MDEVNNARIQPQGSVCSDFNGDDNNSNNNEVTSANNDGLRRLCLVGNVADDEVFCNAANSFGIPVVASKTGAEYAMDDSCTTIFVLDKFEGDVYNSLFKAKHSLLGTTALQQLARDKKPLPMNTRPLFCLAMTGVVVCFTGFRDKEDLIKLVPIIHHMGGSIRKEMCSKVTHLIANVSGGDKYNYANTFRVPIMNFHWVFASWERRYDLAFSAVADNIVNEHKLKPFHGLRVCFVGFAEEEEKHMTEVLISNGGSVTKSNDEACTHVVMEHSDVYTLEAATAANAPLSPKSPKITSSALPSPNNISIISQTPNNPAIIINNAQKYDQYANQSCLETVQEISNDFIDNLNLNATGNRNFDKSCDSLASTSKRKRKFVSPDANNSLIAKRKREKCQSERRRKVSEFFKTPINYFSNRRRTIDASTFNQTLNESVLSSSGVFNVETVQNLSSISNVTPLHAGSSSVQKSTVKKNLFTRTFSSSRFMRGKSKKKDLNATNLSFADASVCEVDGNENEQFNSTCFPEFSSLNSNARSNDVNNEFGRSTRGATVAVVDESNLGERPDEPSKSTKIVKAEWFWTSVQKQSLQRELDYLYDDYVEQILSPNSRRDSHAATPANGSRRKRKRIQDNIIKELAAASPGIHKRRSSVSDAAILSVSGSFLDCTPTIEKPAEAAEATGDNMIRKVLTARHQVFLELVQTESNYVDILKIIVEVFKNELEKSADDEEDQLLNTTEINFIFGKLPPIYETHMKMLEDFRQISADWTEDKCIGNIILKYSGNLLKAYPLYINFFEEMKEVLTQCDQTKPRFHAFLKANQTKPECGRQSLQDLMIRPVQRLGSISLLLNDILKSTPKTNPDHEALEKALAALREVMTHINEDKRKAEGQITLFNIFNDIDNCPPDIVSSHRCFVARTEVVQISTCEGLSSKGSNLVLFLFSDQLEICKKKSKTFNSLKSPSGVSSLQRAMSVKPYKHVKLMPLNTIKRVIDIKDTEDCQRVFSLVCKHTDVIKERLYSFVMIEEEADKTAFLKTLTRQMANNACTADADKFLAYLEPHQLDIDTIEPSNGTLSKAFKLATKAKSRVGRAFSFNKTPSKLKRAVSSMMSPFGSSTNLTPASQLSQMRLASCNNVSELGNAENADESPPVVPMSVQPTRKMKASSLGTNALKRL